MVILENLIEWYFWHIVDLLNYDAYIFWLFKDPIKIRHNLKTKKKYKVVGSLFVCLALCQIFLPPTQYDLTIHRLALQFVLYIDQGTIFIVYFIPNFVMNIQKCI